MSFCIDHSWKRRNKNSEAGQLAGQFILTLKLSFLLLLVNEWNYLAAIFIKNENPMSYFISLDIHLAS